jgi:mono/diheme cytochrome c family protein
MRLVLVILVACSSTSAPPANVATPRPSEDVPISDPAEYAIDRITREAGKAIFERTGIGDPYRTGIPYPMFLALLKTYPATLGQTTQELADKFGFVARAADPKSTDADVRAGLPLGMHLTTDPITNVPFVVTSCALCHAERIRWRGGEATIIGLGNKRVRIHAYDRAFAEITAQPSFTAKKLNRLATELAQQQTIAWPERYAELLAGATVENLKKRATARAELHARTRADPPGRVAVIETFALVLGELAKQRVSFAPEVGWAKVPDVIGYAQRTTLSWDASQEGPIDLLVVEADIAAGVRIAWLEQHPFQGASLGAYLRQPAPRPKFPGKIDRARAERGKALFEQHCSDCHGTYGADGRVLEYDESVVPIEDLKTDPARLQAATADFERAANDPALTRGYTRFRRSTGYVPPVLTNVWTRAPYGHAGQWPSLAVLATPPEKRPTRFALDLGGLYDLETVGIATADVAGAFHHDATRPGFGVGGHPFLADLGADAALVIEYLKTL